MGRPINRYCRSCGARAPEDGRFCPKCGANLNLATPYPEPAREAEGWEPPRPDSPRTVVTTTVPSSVRIGFGFAAGMTLFWLVLVVVIVAAVALATGVVTLTWPFAEAGQRFEGTGPVDSVPTAFDGTYRIDWSATPTSPVACRLDAFLALSGNSPAQQPFLPVATLGAKDSAGDKTLTIARGSYTVHVESDCRWVLRFVRQ